jgi:hypothetical protein
LRFRFSASAYPGGSVTAIGPVRPVFGPVKIFSQRPVISHVGPSSFEVSLSGLALAASVSVRSASGHRWAT